MQFLFIPIWGRLSDRIGRRPVLLWSIAASAVGMALLGAGADAGAAVRWRAVWSGIATANIAVAQAYIADVTPPEKRARGMGIIGIAFGLGFIFGPFVGGELSAIPIGGRPGRCRRSSPPRSPVLNLLLALWTLPESLPPAARGQRMRRAVPIDLAARARGDPRSRASAPPIAINFILVLWFAGMEQTFRLFTADGFGMSDAATGRVFGVVGVVGAIVQGGHRARGWRAAVRRGAPRPGAASAIQALAFALLGASPTLGPWGVGALYTAAGLIALGSGLTTPTLPAYRLAARDRDHPGRRRSGRCSRPRRWPGRVGPLVGGALYASIDPRAPYFIGAIGLALARPAGPRATTLSERRSRYADTYAISVSRVVLRASVLGLVTSEPCRQTRLRPLRLAS